METMQNIALAIGCAIMGAGGALLALMILSAIGDGLCCAWVAFSNAFRSICKAESLIHEYRKNREEFLEWLKQPAE